MTSTDHGRPVFAYVVEADGVVVRLNVHQQARGKRAALHGSTCNTLQVGSRFGIRSGPDLLVAETIQLKFEDPAAAQRAGVGTGLHGDEPLRQLLARVAGRICSTVSDGQSVLEFVPGSLESPSLGAAAVPLADAELDAIYCRGGERRFQVGVTGDTLRPVTVSLDDMLPRHVAVLGSTGQGKTSFVSALLQRLVQTYPRIRCVVFDVHGEYAQALSRLQDQHRPGLLKLSQLGLAEAEVPDEGCERFPRIPYPAFGRQGLEALVAPSDRAQRPALRFALHHLSSLTWNGEGANLAGASDPPVFFEDCRAGSAERAYDALTLLRSGKSTARAAKWPNFRAAGALASDYWVVEPGRNDGSYVRNGYRYGHIAGVVLRIQQLAEDADLSRVMDFRGAGASLDETISDPFHPMRQRLVARVFGSSAESWGVHVLDLRRVGHDHLPFLLSGMLQALLQERISRGPDQSNPLLLVLEEAHHFARRPDTTDESAADLLPYERLAKEGRKFGVSLLLSTQRPSEVRQAVLSQCGTWFCLRLASEEDREKVRHASEWADRALLNKIASLPKHEAIAFGAAFAMPVHLRLPPAEPKPNSRDPGFHEAWSAATPPAATTPAANDG